jgi:hypothetical protein
MCGPVWVRFGVLLPERPAVSPTHPLGCHRRVPERVVFAHVAAALVHGSGYERVARLGCSDRTIGGRVREWVGAGLAEALHALALAQYDRLIGLGPADLAVDGCVTKAPGGGETAGRASAPPLPMALRLRLRALRHGGACCPPSRPRPSPP